MMMLKVLAVAATAAAVCQDDPTFFDEFGNGCSFYASLGSCMDAAGISDLGKQRLLASCGVTCNSCVKANDFCEVGLGGDRYEPIPLTSNFDFYQQPFLNTDCNWLDTPEGLRQETNAWGNSPGENVIMGCIAMLKTVQYTDFIMEVEAWHDDDDASGIIFGGDPNDPTMFYKSMMFNDDWLEMPTDGVNGPFLKITKKNGLPCNGSMTVETDCYDMLSYIARDDPFDDFNLTSYPRQMLTSMDYIPNGYAPIYDSFKYHNDDNRPVRFTLVVYQGQARAYFWSENNLIVGTWTDLPADYVGGRVGIFTSAHQANYKSIKIVDLSAGATPMTNLCAQPGATCDTTIGLCVGGPTAAPTSTPTVSPTYLENCQDPFRHPASDVCPNPQGGKVVTYDTTSLASWELVDQAVLSTNCSWGIDTGSDGVTGITQTTNAWGNYPNDNSLLGCIALVPDTYTDFIAEYDAVHLDNDAWGFVFGYNSELDNYIAHTINDVWPAAAVDGIPGPNSKLRKTTGLPCLELMDATNVCYETLGYTDKDGYSDFGQARIDGPRSKEYEFTHPYAASSSWQPHKISLIVQGQEARIVFKSPDTTIDADMNALRQGNRYQAAMAFDLKGYAGGRVGIWMHAHQMIVSNFKITDLSDPSNMPTAYCGGDAGSYCDAGITGLCLGVAASDVCEGAVGTGVTEWDTTDVGQYEFIEDEGLNAACDWAIGAGGNLRQFSNANRNQGAMLGCNALVGTDEYTDVMMEMVFDNQDNDGIGFNFGWKGVDDFFRVHKINDVWNNPLADSVAMPHFKIQKRLPGTSCAGWTNASNPCFQAIAYVDNYGSFHDGMFADAIAPAGECGYSNVYLPYDQSDISKMYLIIKNNQVRATYESPLSRRQVTVQAFDLTKYGYTGGRIGLYMFAHQAEIYRLAISTLTGAGAATQFCNGDPCSPRTGRCLGSPTMSPTPNPTNAPTVFPTPNVAANEFCQGPVSTSTTVVDTTDLSQFLLVDHPLLTTACDWTVAADGLSQNSEAWGNSPGDNTLMGCMAMYQGASYTDFIAEIDVTHIDNDGWGIVFGYNAIDDHYLGIAMNDRWPNPAADGVSGPFLKLKKHNGKEVLPQMDASNTCFDKLSHLDLGGFDTVAMQGGTGVGLPKEYASVYPYGRGTQFEDTKIVLIVKGQEARLYYPTPQITVRNRDINAMRQPQTITSTWTFDLQGYTGGQIGVFTYAHQATFNNWKITDITNPATVTDYCDGHPHMQCDNQRGDASTGLCFAVPIADVCEGPVGDKVTMVDTGGVFNEVADFEFIEDPVELTDACVWGYGKNGHLYQSTNAYGSDTLLFGCHAIVMNKTFTDMVMQVDIDNDDDDAVGFDFGWKSLDDHFKCYKMNDAWPNPSADALPGPVMKVMKKVPGIDCASSPFNATYSCYISLAYVDQFGVYHDGMPSGAVTPFAYSKAYIPFENTDKKRLILIIRDQALRLIYEDAATGFYVGAFVFDMTPYGYTGGQVGLHVAAHQAEFSDFRVAELTGENATTTFCNGGICDTTTGLCTTTPTMNPTSRVGDVALPDMCPAPVGGAATVIDTTDISQFTFVDQEPISTPCQWEVTATGLRQFSNAWGNYPSDNSLLGCIAVIGTGIYTDFMVEVSAVHEDDDAWGFVFGYDGKQSPPQNFLVEVQNDKWPDPPGDGVRGPFAKFKVTNQNPCIAGSMNATADNMCYDTISYNDYLGRFNIDGVEQFAVPGEYFTTYPYKNDEVFPDNKMTLIVKDGMARFMVIGPSKDLQTPLNGIRIPSGYISTWSMNLDAWGYAGGQIGIWTSAHTATFTDLTITDLSNDANLPTDYCGGNALCADGVCTSLPVRDVCEDPVGAEVIDLTTLNAFDFVDDSAEIKFIFRSFVGLHFVFSDSRVVRSRSCDHSCRGKKNFENFWIFLQFYLVLFIYSILF